MWHADSLASGAGSVRSSRRSRSHSSGGNEQPPRVASRSVRPDPSRRMQHQLAAFSLSPPGIVAAAARSRVTSAGQREASPSILGPFGWLLSTPPSRSRSRGCSGSASSTSREAVIGDLPREQGGVRQPGGPSAAISSSARTSAEPCGRSLPCGMYGRRRSPERASRRASTSSRRSFAPHTDPRVRYRSTSPTPQYTCDPPCRRDARTAR